MWLIGTAWVRERRSFPYSWSTPEMPWKRWKMNRMLRVECLLTNRYIYLCRYVGKVAMASIQGTFLEMFLWHKSIL